MKRYFSAESKHGSNTSMGFSNDTIVLAFSSKQCRDAYVEKSNNISCVAIKKKEVSKYATNANLLNGGNNAPRPFFPEAWCIVDDCYYLDTIPGCIGMVDTCSTLEGDFERLY